MTQEHDIVRTKAYSHFVDNWHRRVRAQRVIRDHVTEPHALEVATTLAERKLYALFVALEAGEFVVLVDGPQ